MDSVYLSDVETISYVAILVTAPGHEQGVAIARTLVEEEIAACVNIIDGLTSIFTWKGKVDEEAESLLIIKTRSERVPDIIQRVRSLHPYDVPEVIVLPILDGNPAYLEWIDEVT
jgi:periplasmic divalent cation tolerance protein